MLHQLHTLYRPSSVREALDRLRESGAYPVFGGGAYLLRLPTEAQREVNALVDLADLAPSNWQINEKRLEIGSAATLTTLSSLSADMAAIVAAEAPLTLRNTLTLGDILMEARHDSLLLGVLYGLGAHIVAEEAGTQDVIGVVEWCTMPFESRRQRVLLGAIIQNYNSQWRYTFAKVSRTPSDAPIVAAIGFAYQGEPDPGTYSVIIGVAASPIRYSEALQASYSDYKGSTEYRTKMAVILHAEALNRARMLTHAS